MKGGDNMTEYRIMAYFTNIYSPRSYKRKIFNTLEEAEKVYKEAVNYYSGSGSSIFCGYKYLDKVVIESREVTEWR